MKKFSKISVLITTLLLQGCVAAAVMTTTAVGTKTALDPRTLGTQLDDGIIELRVYLAMYKEKNLNKEARIKVTSYQGKVLLTGQAPNKNISYRAQKIAMGISNVAEVYNEIRNCKPILLNTILVDTWITTKIRLLLLGSDQVKSSNVKITTENSEVFMLGLVTEREGKAAAEIASLVSGVKHVTTAFTFIN